MTTPPPGDPGPTPAPAESRALLGLRIGLALAVTAGALYGLAKGYSVMKVAPTKDSQGMTLDPFANAKELFVIFFAAFTTVLGWVFGAAGKEKAENQNAVAQAQLKSVLAFAPADVIERARTQFPEAFGPSFRGKP